MKNIQKLTIIALILCTYFGCTKKTELENIDTSTFNVQAISITPTKISNEILLNGSIKAWEEANIYPRLSGKLLKNILREGDNVKKGQTIATIDRDEVGANYQPTLVPSTIDGVIGTMYLDPGTSVTPLTPIALVVNQTKVRVLIEVPERYVGQVSLGQKATFTIEAYKDKTFEGTIYKISPVVDQHTRSITVELAVDNQDNLLKSGMFAKVELVLQSKEDVIVLTKDYFLTETNSNDEKSYFVFVLQNDNTIKKTPIQLGLTNQKEAEVVSGLTIGQKVVKIIFGLKDGSKVKIGA